NEHEVADDGPERCGEQAEEEEHQHTSTVGTKRGAPVRAPPWARQPPWGLRLGAQPGLSERVARRAIRRVRAVQRLGHSRSMSRARTFAVSCVMPAARKRRRRGAPRFFG